MYDLKVVARVVEEKFGAKIISINELGTGISGSVKKVVIDKPPYQFALKGCKDSELLKKESFYIEYIRARVDIKLPQVYHVHLSGTENFMLMESIDGISCGTKAVLHAKKQQRLALAEQMADTIIKLQDVHGEMYGEIENPIYTNWHDYYKPFAENLLKSAETLTKQGYLKKSVLKIMHLGVAHYAEIFSDAISKPTLIHGDYWANNILADKDFNVVGVVDPFHVMWADSEYELFALNAIFGKKLPVLEAFLKKRTVSEKFPVKNEFYKFFSEVYWVSVLKHNNNGYLKSIGRAFLKQFKRFKIGK